MADCYGWSQGKALSWASQQEDARRGRVSMWEEFQRTLSFGVGLLGHVTPVFVVFDCLELLIHVPALSWYELSDKFSRVQHMLCDFFSLLSTRDSLRVLDRRKIYLFFSEVWLWTARAVSLNSKNKWGQTLFWWFAGLDRDIIKWPSVVNLELGKFLQKWPILLTSGFWIHLKVLCRVIFNPN